jgi:hypothetical protein
MVHLQVPDGSAALAAPAVTLEYLSPELLEGIVV